MNIFLRSSMCFRVPHLCSKIPKINNWSMDSGVHSVCFRGDFAIKTVVEFLRSNSFEMWHTFKHFIHMQYFLLPINLVIVFVHWISTGVLYESRQCSLFWDYIPESKLCSCLNLCRPPGTYSIRPIQKLLNCQQRDDARCPGCRHSSRWGATKNSAVALSSRNNMISIHQRSARTNESKTTLI